MSVANTGDGTVTTVGYLPVLVANTTTSVPHNPSTSAGKLYTLICDETHVYNITLNYDFEFPPSMIQAGVAVYTFDGAFEKQLISSTVPAPLNSGSPELWRYSTQVNLTPSTFDWGGETPTYWFTASQFNNGLASMVVNLEIIITDLGIFVAG